MMRPVKKGSTDQSVVIRIVDSTDGTPETTVEHNTSGIDLWYRREGATKTSITEAALAALDTAHADGGIEHIGDGYYRLDLPDAACASGANGVMVGGTVTGMVVIGCYVPLVDFDPYDATRMGMTAPIPDGHLTSAKFGSLTAPTAAPSATPTLFDAVAWLFTLGRNKITQTATTQALRNDGDSANIATSTVSDDGTTFTRGKYS